ncbi:Hypothetical_protein [Hexamita inflata]|uniref:Hypothetical_protein n=1 Tax=Hexamita inflata TaxID=28002 RepID=A0AA86UDR1_9EUKA|nr:Hypothetical protein HINF_LOCUS41790 [Hexamita inflata]
MKEFDELLSHCSVSAIKELSNNFLTGTPHDKTYNSIEKLFQRIFGQQKNLIVFDRFKERNQFALMFWNTRLLNQRSVSRQNRLSSPIHLPNSKTFLQIASQIKLQTQTTISETHIQFVQYFYSVLLFNHNIQFLDIIFQIIFSTMTKLTVVYKFVTKFRQSVDLQCRYVYSDENTVA